MSICKNKRSRLRQDFGLRISPTRRVSNKDFEAMSREVDKVLVKHGFKMGFIHSWSDLCNAIVEDQEVVDEAARRAMSGAQPAMLQPADKIAPQLKRVICAALNRRLALRATGLESDFHRADGIGFTLANHGLVWDYHLDTAWHVSPLSDTGVMVTPVELRKALRRVDPKYPAWRFRRLSVAVQR